MQSLWRAQSTHTTTRTAAGSDGSGDCRCNAGYTGPDGSDDCTACVAGKYKTVPGSAACTDCLSGTFSLAVAATAASACSACPAHSFSPMGDVFSVVCFSYLDRELCHHLHSICLRRHRSLPCLPPSLNCLLSVHPPLSLSLSLFAVVLRLLSVPVTVRLCLYLCLFVGSCPCSCPCY